MKKKCVSKITGFTNDKALHVVAHGRWQQSRGRNPSLSYQGESNPKKAFKKALLELRTYDALCGSSILLEIVNMLNVARITKKSIVSTFNGTNVWAYKTDVARKLVASYLSERDHKSAAYRATPEFQARAFDRWMDIRSKQLKYNQLMDQLPELDFTDTESVLDWCSQLDENGGDVGVEKVTNENVIIIKTFKAHGYYRDANCGPDFNEEDADNVVRYIIGQAIACIEDVGYIPGIFESFASDWKKKFGTSKTITAY